jgi:hypothetical protein
VMVIEGFNVGRGFPGGAWRRRLVGAVVAAGLFGWSGRMVAQEPPYLATYSDVLEEPGNVELATQNIYSAPKDANPFYGQTVEMEYGLTAWWTTEAYVQGQTTEHDSTIFTGFRFENRFRPLRGAHWVNPVVYLEYEDVNEADKSFLEVTGNHVIQDQQVSNALLRKDVERSIEGKIILSSYVRGVNLSENFIAEKNVSNEPWEFGYAMGASRPLANGAGGEACRFCRRYFAVGAEMFGGLGTRYTFGLKGTEHYAGPTLAYSSPRGMTLLVGPEFGLNPNSAAVLWRVKASYEFNQVRELFRRQR